MLYRGKSITFGTVCGIAQYRFELPPRGLGQLGVNCIATMLISLKSCAREIGILPGPYLLQRIPGENIFVFCIILPYSQAVNIPSYAHRGILARIRLEYNGTAYTNHLVLS